MAVSLRVTGTWAELTADGAVAIPATPQAGDRMFLFARWKDFSITAQVTSPVAWTEITEFADGAITAGNGTGSVKVGCWYRDWQSGDTNPTLDFSASPDNASVVIMVMQKAADDVWGTPVARTAAMTNWTTTSQIVSASSTVSVPAGSVVMGLIGIRDDTAAMTRPTTGIDDSAGAITWNGDYVESPATHHSTTTGFDGAADLGYRLVTLGATVTLRMTGTISAAETGAALWIIQDTTIVVTPAAATLTISSFAPSLKTSVIPAAAALAITSFAPSLANIVIPASQSLTITTFAPTLPTIVVPASFSLSLTTFAPSILPFGIVFLDPGGDAVQAVEYFALAQGTNAPTFDTSQKVVGVGSYKFNTGAGSDNSYNKVAGVLGASRRIGFYFRYDSVPDTDAVVGSFAGGNPLAYSGGGFVDPTDNEWSFDDGVYATATPSKNSAQGTTLRSFTLNVPQDAVIDSIKIIYERKYDTAASIGTSRVRYLVGAEEGPNHDNTDMPTTDTVVEVDITADRTWTHTEVNAIQVIAEALRGDTDTSHTQSWDYVKVEVEYHTAINFLWCQTTGGSAILRLQLLPTGSGMTLRLGDAAGFEFNGITVIPPDEDHRIALCFNQNDTDDLDVKLYVDGVEELSLVERETVSQPPGSWPDLRYGWLSNDDAGANQVCWIDQLYIDEGDDLSDPGPWHMTAKRGASTNVDDFDTTGGTGAVNERPVNLANYRQQAGATQVFQNYTLEAAAVGDVDISGKDFGGYMGWVVARRTGPVSTGAGFTLNGVTTNVTLLAGASPYFFHKLAATSASYPSDAAGIGLRSITTGGGDVFLYECGVIVAYEAPIDDILFPRYLLLEDSETEVFDDLRVDPPDTYALRYIVDGPETGAVEIKAYSIGTEDGSPQLQTTIGPLNGGTGSSQIGTPGIEVRVVIVVTGADMHVTLSRLLS